MKWTGREDLLISLIKLPAYNKDIDSGLVGKTNWSPAYQIDEPWALENTISIKPIRIVCRTRIEVIGSFDTLHEKNYYKF